VVVYQKKKGSGIDKSTEGKTSVKADEGEKGGGGGGGGGSGWRFGGGSISGSISNFERGKPRPPAA